MNRKSWMPEKIEITGKKNRHENRNAECLEPGMSKQHVYDACALQIMDFFALIQNSSFNWFARSQGHIVTQRVLDMRAARKLATIT